ncbi:MAG: hypothetical protein WBA67_06485 [Jannaschia sp.]
MIRLVLAFLAAATLASAAPAEQMQRILNAPAAPVVGTPGSRGPHGDGRNSIGFHGPYGWTAGYATCPTGTVITPIGTCVDLKRR